MYSDCQHSDSGASKIPVSPSVLKLLDVIIFLQELFSRQISLHCGIAPFYSSLSTRSFNVHKCHIFFLHKQHSVTVHGFSLVLISESSVNITMLIFQGLLFRFCVSACITVFLYSKVSQFFAFALNLWFSQHDKLRLSVSFLCFVFYF